MKAITVVYCDPTILAASVAQFLKTSGTVPDEWIFVDNTWPLLNENLRFFTISQIAQMGNGICQETMKNLGGHGGFNFGLNQMAFEDDETILCFDADAFPAREGWLQAMMRVMAVGSKIGYLSLLPHQVKRDDWNVETIAGYRVGFLDQAEMINISLWRGSVLREGMKANSAYYGHIEVPMLKKAQSMGLRVGYLLDYPDAPHPIPHHPKYTEWKNAHAFEGYKGNFDEFLSECSKSPEPGCCS